MNEMIYNPLKEFDSKFKSLHLENTKKHFEALTLRSGIDVEANRKTVKEYVSCNEQLTMLRKKLTWIRVLRVLCCITLLLIPLVIIKLTPRIRGLRGDVVLAENKAAELLSEATRQMTPLCALFSERDALDIIEATVPMLSFAPCFSVEQEENMIINYDFCDHNNAEQSSLAVLAGHYNENPFVFEKRLTHKMGEAVYHGYKVIRWTESYRGSDGKRRTRTRTQTLHASVIKPKPIYTTEVLLSYCAQGGPDLSFTRDATHLDEKSEREIDRYVKRGEKKLKRLTDEAIKENRDFTSMSNADFEVLFDALDRTDEVQFRTLFTPLAQTNMVDLIRSKSGYGDDFHFIKEKRTNRIQTEHSRTRAITLSPDAYVSYSYDTAKESFIDKNAEYFKAVYFDFAPLWAIPLYQERPVHSLEPVPEYAQSYAYKECEALANAVPPKHVVHPRTKTPAILKSSFVGTKDGADEVSVLAYSYDIEKRIDFIPVLGGDGRFHSVPVPWDDYLPLEESRHFLISTAERAMGTNILGRRGELCIFD